MGYNNQKKADGSSLHPPRAPSELVIPEGIWDMETLPSPVRDSNLFLIGCTENLKPLNGTHF